MKRAPGRLGVPTSSLMLLLVIAVALGGQLQLSAAARQPKASALFAFGDSYADTGNRDNNASSFHIPYGITWPGYPTGRFSNGHLQTDYLARYLGLPSPTPYKLLGKKSIKRGINFAIGGSGVTFAYGVPPLGSQIDSFELILSTGAYSPSFLASSVVLVSIVGNDYGAYPNGIAGLVPVVEEGMAVSLKRLYNLGLKNILVSNLGSLECLPQSTITSNYTNCSSATVPLILEANNILEQKVTALNKLPGANIIILDARKVFGFVLNNTNLFGITEKLEPCCKPNEIQYSCGQVDLQGNPLYTVCPEPSKHTFWDSFHPTQSTWEIVVGLYNSEPGFLSGASTLQTWFHDNNLRPTSAPAPSPFAPAPLQGAVKELETAYNAMIFKSNYSEAIGLLQTIDLDDYLSGLSATKATIFLPNNEAFFSVPSSAIDAIYAENKLLQVLGFHSLEGFYDIANLTSASKSFTTFSGLQLLITPSPTGILVGPEAAHIVDPDLYTVKGQIVIHGIDAILFPPSQ